MDWHPFRVYPQDLVPGPPELFVINKITWIHLIIYDLVSKSNPDVKNLKFTFNIMVAREGHIGPLQRNWRVALTKHITIHGNWWHHSTLQQIRSLVEDFGPIRFITVDTNWPRNHKERNLLNYPALILFRLINRHTYYKKKEIVYNCKNWGRYRYQWKAWYVFNHSKLHWKIRKVDWEGPKCSLNFLF